MMSTIALFCVCQSHRRQDDAFDSIKIAHRTPLLDRGHPRRPGRLDPISSARRLSSHASRKWRAEVATPYLRSPIITLRTYVRRSPIPAPADLNVYQPQRRSLARSRTHAVRRRCVQIGTVRLCIAAAHGRFNRIHQVAPICTPSAQHPHHTGSVPC